MSINPEIASLKCPVLIWVIMVLITFNVGCSVRLATFPLVTTKEVSGFPVKSGADARGEDCVHMISFIPIGGLRPQFTEAVRRALDSGGGDFLLNARIYNKFFITLVYSRVCIVAEGTLGFLESHDP